MVKLRYGNTNTFLLCGNAANLLIDADYAGTLPAFYKEIKKHGIDVRDITVRQPKGRDKNTEASAARLPVLKARQVRRPDSP